MVDSIRRPRTTDPASPRLRRANYGLRNLFIIELTYKVPLAEIDQHMREHMRFLNKYYASGHFVVSGRKIPREGGIIVAVGGSLEEIEAIAREDPFCARGLADVRVIEFRVSQKAADAGERIGNG